MYFSLFPLTIYSFDGKNASLLVDIMRRVSISRDVLDNTALYTPYLLQDGETPEILAHRVYGSSTLHWVLLLTNEIIDPRFDWCMSQENLLAYAESKYDNIYATHHYIDDDGLIVDAGLDKYPVSNIQHEIDLNEKRREIKILSPDLVSQFVKEFEDKIK